MNLCLVNKTKYSFELFTGGMDGICNVYEVQMKLNNGTDFSNHNFNDQSTSNSAYLRRRNFSFNSQHSNEYVEGNTDVDDNRRGSKASLLNSDSGLASGKHKKYDDLSKANPNIPEYRFDFKLKNFFQTDFESSEPFQKMVKYSDATNMLFSAGADGVIRFWSLPD